MKNAVFLFPVSLYDKLENSLQTATETFDTTGIIPPYLPAVAHSGYRNIFN